MSLNNRLKQLEAKNKLSESEYIAFLIRYITDQPLPGDEQLKPILLNGEREKYKAMTDEQLIEIIRG